SRVVALMIRRLCFYGRLGLLLSWLLRGFCGGRRLVLRWCLAGSRSGLRALCIACVSDELIVVLAGGVAARFTSGTQRGGAVLSIGGGSGARPEGVLASSNQAVDSLLAVIVTRGGLLEACGGFWRSSCRGVRGGRLGRCLGVSRCSRGFSGVVAGGWPLSLWCVLLWRIWLLRVLSGILLRLLLHQVRSLLRSGALLEGGCLRLLVRQRLDRTLGCAKLRLSLLGLTLELLVLRGDLLQLLLRIAQRLHGSLVCLGCILDCVIRGLTGCAQARFFISALGA